MFQSECSADLIDQITLVGKVDSFGNIDKCHKCGGFFGNLGGVVEFQAFAFVHRRLLVECCLLEELVELASADPGGVLSKHIVHMSEDRRHPEPSQGRNGDGRRKIQEFGFVPEIIHIAFQGLLVFFDPVPFVEKKNTAASSFKRISGHMDILLGNAFFDVEYDQSHIASVHTLQGFDDGKFLDFFIDLGFAADTGRIDQQIGFITASA